MKRCYFQVLSLTACDSPRLLRMGLWKRQESKLQVLICLPVRAGVMGLCVNKCRSLHVPSQALLQLQSIVLSAACPEQIYQIYGLGNLEIFSIHTRHFSIHIYVHTYIYFSSHTRQQK